MKLFRPVNINELNLIIESGYNGFPPRLPEQPIFYPVLNFDYAKRINQWNIDSYGDGWIIEFSVDNDYISKFDVHNVGGEGDDEYWIPAEELEEFNKHIKIKGILHETVRSYRLL